MIHKTTRSILSVLLAALLLVASIPLTPAFAGEGGAVSQRSENSESRELTLVDGVYQIYTADDLKEFAVIVNGTDSTPADSDANAKLMNDIDLSSVCGPELNNGTSWTPIGGSGNPYSGTFDGDGHTISGLNISDSTYRGIFGYVGTSGGNTGTVKNLTVDCTVSSIGTVGGVVGRNDGTVTNCTNTGKVSGSGSVGGVVGNNSGTVTGCYNTGDVKVSGSGFVGGVVGENFGSVTGCYNTGKVSGPDSGSGNYVGGVVGQNGDTVTSCYNTGSVSGGSSKGGVVGLNSDTVTGCYFLQQDGLSGGATGATELTAEDFKKQDSFSGWTDFDTTWSISGILGRPVLKSNPQGGLGTQASPYQISTATQLKNFATAVNDGDYDAWAVLMENINLSEICGEHAGNWTPIGTSSKAYTGTFNGNGKTISGLYIDSNADDQGLFGYVGTNGKIENLTVEGSITVTGSVSTGNYVGGVVGYNNDGTVTGCTFSGSGSVSGVWSVGGVVGYNNGGTVTSCTFSGSGSVSGLSPVGGVVGNNDNSGSVENCHNTGTGTVTVSGVWSVGGVVGSNYNASVENCYNIGKVTGSADTSNVGGVVGYNDVTPLGASSVTNCHNTGNISGNNSGGVVGYNINSVTNCYNTGEVSGNNSGGVVGYNSSSVVGENSGSVENCYNTGNVSGGSKGGVVGYNDGDSVANCYFLQTDDVNKNLQGIGVGSGDANGKNDTAFHSGEVAWLLENGQAEDQTTPVWGQNDLKTDKSWPTLVALDKNAKPVYKVAFISDNTEIDAKYANNGMTVDLPATEPTKEGYTFNGWFTEASGGSQWNFSTVVTENMTLYAQWTKVEEPEPDPDPTPTPTPDPEPSGPSTGDSTGWADILDELENAENGDQITIDMGDETTVPAEIFAGIAGKDVDVIFDLGDVQWSASGETIPTDTDFTDLDLGVDLGTSGIPVNVINTITGEVGTVQITLAHNGEFGFTLTLTAPLGKENAGYWANLYHFDESAEALNFEAAAKIDETGSVTIPFSHASQYAIVIDTHSHATVDVSDLFIDIAPNAWYKDAVQYAYDNGLMTGVSATEFAPEATTTRAMIVSILARLENVTTAEAAGFADVDDNDWYATAVNWAANVGVVNGYEDNTFRPNTAITREQLAAILMNYAAYKGEDVSNRADLTSYTDQPSTWAQEAMQWAVAEKLITGVTNDELQPQSSATRAQVAAILQRFLEA